MFPRYINHLSVFLSEQLLLTLELAVTLVDDGICSAHMDKSYFNLQLLGAFRLEKADGQLVELSSRKSRALLVLLALSRNGTVGRERLAGYLWSDTELQFAKTNLRQCLSSLRKQIDNKSTTLIESIEDRLQLDLTKIRVDALELQTFHKIDPLKADLEEIVGKVQRLEFSSRQLLPDFPRVDDEFDCWLADTRTSLQIGYARNLEQLLQMDRQSSTAAKYVAKELINVEPANENAHQWLVKFYTNQGDRSAAIRQYQDACDALRAHHDAEPGVALTQLFQSLRQSGIESATPTQSMATQLSSPLGEKLNGAPRPAKRNLQWMWLVGACAAFAVVISFYHLVFNKQSALENMAYANAETEQRPRYPILDGTTTRAPEYTIAIVPFKNVSDDPNQLYLSDGLSEDLVTEISRVSGLRVIASQSSFLFRDAEKDLDVIRKKLAVDYVLTGSVQRVGDNIRINAHLLRTSDGVFIWSDKFDRKIGHVLQVQDEITRHILGSLSVKLTDSEWKRLSHTREVSPQAYDLLLRGLHPLSQFTENGVNTARGYFKEAIAADEHYARPYANLALTYGREVVFGFADADPESIRLGLDYADRAERLDPSLPQTQFARAVLHLANREHTLAVRAARRSIALDANYADGYAVLSQTLAYKGELDIALEAIAQAKILNPVIPFMYHWVEGHILYQLGRYEEARIALEAVYGSNPSFYLGLITLSATYAQLGLLDDSDWINGEILTHKPDFSAKQECLHSPYFLQKHRHHLLDGLQKAGLPE